MGETGSATALLGLVVGVLTPPIVAILQQPKWTARTRSIVGVLIAIALGVATCAVDGSLDSGRELSTTITAVIVASQTAYSQFWKKVGVARAIESATSPSTGQHRESSESPEAADGVFAAEPKAPPPFDG